MGAPKLFLDECGVHRYFRHRDHRLFELAPNGKEKRDNGNDQGDNADKGLHPVAAFYDGSLNLGTIVIDVFIGHFYHQGAIAGGIAVIVAVGADDHKVFAAGFFFEIELGRNLVCGDR